MRPSRIATASATVNAASAVKTLPPVRTRSTGYALMQAARWSARAPLGARSSGSVARHSGIAIGQRGLKRHPGGIAIGFGVSPRRICGATDDARVPLGHDRDERLRVRVLAGCVTTSRAGPSSTIRPEVHDRDPVGVVGRGREVVRDHEDAEAGPAQLVEEREDPGADGDVEHRHGLVGDQELRVEHEARRDGDALALAAGELVREAVEEELGRRQAGARERLADALLALVAGAALAVDEQRLLDRRRAPGTAGRATRTGPGR